jgi:Rps23 Pro-64 3,4-dihydroxylase Tpa1-like proline 4-hydroxylase
MNLVFNLKDKLFWIHNFLPRKLYKEMYIEYIKNLNKLPFKKTKVSWTTFNGETENMSESFGQTKGDEKQDFNLKLFLEKYHIFLRHQQFVNLINVKMDSHLRRWNYMKHLTWHNDAFDPNASTERTYAATFYFNKTWKDSWGGELMFKSNDASGFIPVVGNSLVLVKSGLTHKVNPTLNKNYPRLSIQTWML